MDLTVCVPGDGRVKLRTSCDGKYAQQRLIHDKSAYKFQLAQWRRSSAIGRASVNDVETTLSSAPTVHHDVMESSHGAEESQSSTKDIYSRHSSIKRHNSQL